ncbi:DUF1254 domain-containing protein [Chelativorans sp. M5D2P16]|uniref:DUF1254 domain-containing protein n=1 Tax=Chelativorans sp. M5D2P16 TaxID=3095678 RepID=UPI002ACA04D2|nr:DUF1254 domain-containing protein [Chelativorans sp. M5D2P16]MDZ5698364.1 DUF1254 domain-containing protein [Chelativorans sp. M5D2P16]
MLRILHAVLLGLVGAAIVHIVILVLVPRYSTEDVWTRLSAVARPFETVRLERAVLGADVPEPANPFIEAAVCPFDLGDGTLHVRGSGAVPFWSMSIYDRNGLNVFSISDRAMAGKDLDLVVLTPEQMLRMRRAVPAAFRDSVFIEVDSAEGLLLFRAFVPDETWRGVAETFLEGIRCAPGQAD